MFLSSCPEWFWIPRRGRSYGIFHFFQCLSLFFVIDMEFSPACESWLFDLAISVGSVVRTCDVTRLDGDGCNQTWDLG